MATSTRQARKTQFGPEEIVVAWQSFAWGSYVLREGEKVRGDHPAVKAQPAYFVRDGLPRSEWPSFLDAGIARDDAAAAALPPPAPPRIDPATPLAELVLCIRTVEASEHGPRREGSIYPSSDPLVKIVGECFKPLSERLDG